MEPTPVFTRAGIRLAIVHRQRMGALRRVRKTPRVRPSKRPELEYSGDLIRLLRSLQEMIRAELLPRLPAIVAEVPEALKAKRADAGEILEKTIGDVKIAWAQRAPLVEISRLAARRSAAANAIEQKRIVKAVIGVQPEIHEAWLEPMIGEFSRKNARLITRVSEDFAERIENRVANRVQEGVRATELAKEIEQEFLGEGAEFAAAKSRAKLIARDQIGKLAGDITRVRQTEIGVSRYVWRTSRDERVRGYEKPDTWPGSHVAREGLIFDWSRSIEEQLDEKGLIAADIDGPPGTPINCRCYAEPVLGDLVEDLPEI